MKNSHKAAAKLPRIAIVLALIVSTAAMTCDGQGVFIASNVDAPTRIGSFDGPLAGPGIWGQFLTGSTADSLTPIDVPLEHVSGGRLSGPGIVPGIPCGETAYVQMVAWDGTIWGTALEGVPATQLGRTDIVPVILSCPPCRASRPGLLNRPWCLPCRSRASSPCASSHWAPLEHVFCGEKGRLARIAAVENSAAKSSGGKCPAECASNCLIVRCDPIGSAGFSNMPPLRDWRFLLVPVSTKMSRLRRWALSPAETGRRRDGNEIGASSFAAP